MVGDQDARQNNITLKIAYLDMEGGAIDVTSLEQGTDLTSRLP
ncbi:MAG: hypothetical protein U0176_17910 [Bacteroidia bacterium]